MAKRVYLIYKGGRDALTTRENTMSATKTYAWAEIGTLIEDAGEIGGDVQTGPARSRRFQLALEDGTFANVTTYAYATTEYRETDENGDETGKVSDDSDSFETSVTVYGFTDQVEYLVSHESDDIGGTEINSDYTYNVETHMLTIETHEDADALALEYAKAEDIEFYSYWNGDLSKIMR